MATALDSIVKVIADARVDATTLSDFVFKPADEKVSRRLSSSIHTFQFYLDHLEGLRAVYSQDGGSVTVGGIRRKTLLQMELEAAIAINSAIDKSAIAGALVTDALVTTSKRMVGQVTRTVADRATDSVSIKDLGAIGDGTLHTVAEWTVVGSRVYFPNLAAIQLEYPHVTSLTDSIDWAAIQSGINKQTGMLAPKGNYCVNRAFTLKRTIDIYGHGIRTTTITSYVANESLFKLDPAFVFGNIEFMSIRAHASIANTAGHGISALGLSASEDSDSHSPQFLTIKHVEISGFNGLDEHPTTKLKTLPSCGFIQMNGLRTVLDNVITTGCAIGQYLQDTSTTRITSCTCSGNNYFGIWAQGNTNIVIEGGDYVANGRALSSDAVAKYSLPYTGAVMLYDNYNAVYENNKSKGNACTADIILVGGEGTVVTKNNIRGGYSVEHDAVQSIYVAAIRGFTITHNTFHGINITTTNASATAKYKGITVEPKSLYHGSSGNISYNMFRGLTASTMAYCIGLIGSTTLNRTLFKGMTIDGNQIGNDNRVADWTIETGILVKNCQLQDSSIQRNTGYVPLKLTAGSIVKFESVVSKRNKIMGNGWYYAGTASENGAVSSLEAYSGIDPDTRSFTHKLTTVTDVPASLFTDVIVDAKGVKLGNSYSIDAGTTQPLLGLLMSAWVSANDQVTVRLINASSAPVKLATGNLNVAINRMDRADLGELA